MARGKAMERIRKCVSGVVDRCRRKSVSEMVCTTVVDTSILYIMCTVLCLRHVLGHK